MAKSLCLIGAIVLQILTSVDLCVVFSEERQGKARKGGGGGGGGVERYTWREREERVTKRGGRERGRIGERERDRERGKRKNV